jgi:hypothetical protein
VEKEFTPAENESFAKWKEEFFSNVKKGVMQAKAESQS